MNFDKYPTNNTDFRLAVVHAINYTQLLDETYKRTTEHLTPSISLDLLAKNGDLMTIRQPFDV